MRDVQKHVRERFEFIERIVNRQPEKSSYYEIVPKTFTVGKVSESGRRYLGFETGEKRYFKGRPVTERFSIPGRVFFFPHAAKLDPDSEERYIEIKGYGVAGKEISLQTHGDGDIFHGIFHKNAKKEFNILEKAYAVGLPVPLPLFTGRISRGVWLASGLRAINWLSGDHHDCSWDLETLLKDENKIREEIKRMMQGKQHNIPDFLSAFSQPFDAGVLGRAPLSPLRLGDPADTYELTNENKKIAMQCGNAFFKLIDLGYLHLSPSTGNWTEAGELTDMADCYDLKKDKNLTNVTRSRERRIKQSFWVSLIGGYHTANLSPFFIEGMFGQKVSLEDAAEELKRKTLSKIVELRD